MLPDLDRDELARGNLQALMGVVRNGTDPERVVRRFRVSELTPAALAAVETLPGVQQVQRRISGPAMDRADAGPVVYLEAPLNLVGRGEAIAPGSADWFFAPLWALAGPTLPRLEDLRLGLLHLKQRLGLCNPTSAELAPYLDRDEQAQLAALSLDELKGKYLASLMPLVNDGSSDALSLLAGLVAETFTTDQSDLHEVHCDVFSLALDRLLSPPFSAAVAKDFKTLVGARILLGSWELPFAFHVSSLSAPFMRTEAMNLLHEQHFFGALPPDLCPRKCED